MRRFFQNCCVGLVLAMALLFSSDAFAIEYEALGGRPAYPDQSVENSASWFIYDLEPGEQKQDAVLVVNLFAKPMDAIIYAADSSPSSSGGFALRQLLDEQEKVGTWVKFFPNNPPAGFLQLFEQKKKDITYLCGSEKETLRISLGVETIAEQDWNDLQKWCEGEKVIERHMEAKEEYLIPFVFSVPENADVGEHTGGILIQKKMAEDAGTKEGAGIRLTTRVGVRIYQTVPGDVIKKILLEDFKVIKNFKEIDIGKLFSKEKKPEEYLVQSKVRNEGTTSINHQSNIILKDLLFDRRSEDIQREFQVLRNDSFTSNYAWQSPRFGHFSFQTEIKYEDQNGAEKVITSDVIKLWIIPWREIIISLMIVILILGAIIFFRRRWNRKYSGKGWVRYKVKQSDNIGSLAEKAQVSWKMLARTNKLKKPYHIQAGQAILVPPRGGAKGQGYKVSYKGFIIRMVVLVLIVVVIFAIVMILRGRSDQSKVENKIDIQSPRN